MKIDNLIKTLSKHGHVHICKAGHVFTLLMTGNDLDNATKLMAIQAEVLEETKEYPLLEAMKNTSEFLIMILKPDNIILPNDNMILKPETTSPFTPITNSKK